MACRSPPDGPNAAEASICEFRDDGSTVEVVIWEVPEPVPPSKHGYKYRLYYGANGVARVRYDNERGKGDHRHIGDKEGDH